APDHTRDFLEFPVHRSDKFLFVFVKYGAPLLFRLQPNVIFRIEKARRVGSIIGTSLFTGAFGGLGKRAKQNSGLIHYPDTFARSSARREGATHPERTLI